MADFPYLRDGEWVRVPWPDNVQNIACCDCGLVHRFEFRVITDEDGDHLIEWRASRDEERTAELREEDKMRLTEPAIAS